MSNLSVRTFREDDVGLLTPKEIFEKDATKYFIGTTKNPNCDAYTVTYLDKPIAFICMVRIWNKVAEIMSITSDEVKEHPTAFHRLCKKMIQDHVEVYGIQRVQTIVKSNYNDGCRWLEMLGFAIEGEMKKFGPEGDDYLLMARVD